MVNNKKGFMRTLEMVAAMVITFLFVLFIIPESQPPVRQDRVDVLHSFVNQKEFRNCALIEDSDCIVDLIDPVVPARFAYVVIVTEDPKEIPSDLPQKEIFVDSTLIVENLNTKIIKAYFWNT